MTPHALAPAPRARSVLGAVARGFCVAAVLAGLAVPIAAAWDGAHFWSPVRIAIYGAAPVLLALVALWVLRRGGSAPALFLAYALAVAVGLFGAELYARREAEAVLRTIPKAPNDAGVLRAEGLRVYPHACGIDFGLQDPAIRIGGKAVMPVTGVSRNLLTPDARNRAGWRFSDEHGFNNPPDQWTPGTTVAVGDSFTFGADVPIGRGYVDRLRERLGKVVNLGCSGNGPLLELAGLAEYGPLVRPRLVLWAYYEGNDLIGDIGAERQSPILPSYLSPDFSQHLSDRQDELDAALMAFLDRGGARAAAAAKPNAVARADFLPRPSRETLSLMDLRRALGLGHKFPVAALAGLRDVLTRAKSLVAGWGGRIVFVYLPDEPRYAGVLGAPDAEAYAARVRRVAADLGLPIIDLAPVFARQKRPRALFRGHYTEEGYSLVAETVAEELARLRP